MTEIMPVLKSLNITVVSAGDFANTFYGFFSGAEAVFHVGRHGVVVDFFHDAVADHGFQGGGQDLLGETRQGLEELCRALWPGHQIPDNQ